MRPKPHQFDVLRRTVLALAVHYRTLKHVTELRPRAEVVGSDKVHHTPVLQEVVLQWISSQHYTTSASQRHRQIMNDDGKSNTPVCTMEISSINVVLSVSFLFYFILFLLVLCNPLVNSIF